MDLIIRLKQNHNIKFVTFHKTYHHFNFIHNFIIINNSKPYPSQITSCCRCYPNAFPTERRTLPKRGRISPRTDILTSRLMIKPESSCHKLTALRDLITSMRIMLWDTRLVSRSFFKTSLAAKVIQYSRSSAIKLSVYIFFRWGCQFSEFRKTVRKTVKFRSILRPGRYSDIKAYYQIRVKLSQNEIITGTDYVNANYFMGYQVSFKVIFVKHHLQQRSLICVFFTMGMLVFWVKIKLVSVLRPKNERHQDI